MKTVYEMVDRFARPMTATFEDGELKVTMSFVPQEDLTIEQVCETMGWTMMKKTEYGKPKVVQLKRKED